MSDLLFYDAAYPPARKPAGVQDGVAFYIGGDTPHVWTLQEINAQNVRYRLPIFVRSNPPGPGALADVTLAHGQLQAIGAPRGCLVAWDMETSDDPAYVAAVYGLLLAAGYKLIVYGSQNFVMGNLNPDGLYWGAQWTNVPHLVTGDVMTQYVSLTGYDESEGISTLPFWDTKPLPKPAPSPNIPPIPPGRWLDGVLTGRGMDSSLWTTVFHAGHGWTNPVKQP